MHLFGLAKRLQVTPIPNPKYAYHVTHGIHLQSIQKLGLLPNQPGVQYVTSNVFFSKNLERTLKAYGWDLVESMPRKSGFTFLSAWSCTYFQGVAVLRSAVSFLEQKGYLACNGEDLAGEKPIAANRLELFIDGQWKKLPDVQLGGAQALWRKIYWATPFLRNQR